jgi:hypothetical protein
VVPCAVPATNLLSPLPPGRRHKSRDALATALLTEEDSQRARCCAGCVHIAHIDGSDCVRILALVALEHNGYCTYLPSDYALGELTCCSN